MDYSLTGKKVAIIENNLLSTYTMRESLMLRLRDEGCDITVITQSNQYVDLVQSWGIKVIDVGFSNQNPIKGVRYIYKVLRALRKTKPDVCLTFSIRTCNLGKYNYKNFRNTHHYKHYRNWSIIYQQEYCLQISPHYVQACSE